MLPETEVVRVFDGRVALVHLGGELRLLPVGSLQVKLQLFLLSDFLFGSSSEKTRNQKCQEADGEVKSVTPTATTRDTYLLRNTEDKLLT